jgi:hypothetical protein
MDMDGKQNTSLDISGVGLGSLVPYKNKVMEALIYSGPYDCPYKRYA